MSQKNRIQKYFKVGLRLTQAQRELIFDAEISLTDGTERSIRATPADQRIMLTRDDWEHLARHVAFEANNADDKELQRKLDAIFLKVHELLETHAVEEPAACSEIGQPLAEESAQLAHWAAEMLTGAEQLGIKSKLVVQFPLPVAQLAVVMMTHTVDEKIQKKLSTKHPTLTVGDVGSLLMALAEAFQGAAPLRQFAMIMTAKSLMDCLRFEVNGR